MGTIDSQDRRSTVAVRPAMGRLQGRGDRGNGGTERKRTDTMYLRVYTSLRGLTEDQANQRYSEREKIEADLCAFSSAQMGSEPAHDSLIVSVRVEDPDVRYLPPVGWGAELVDELNDPDYSAPPRED